MGEPRPPQMTEHDFTLGQIIDCLKAGAADAKQKSDSYFEHTRESRRYRRQAEGIDAACKLLELVWPHWGAVADTLRRVKQRGSSWQR